MAKKKIVLKVPQIGKGIDEEDFYPTLEEKAASVLYVIVKHHGFVDGNAKAFV